MSFDDNQKKFERGNYSRDYQAWPVNEPIPPSKMSRFMSMSAIIHVGILIAVGMMAIPLLPEKEVITIEIADTGYVIPKGAAVPETRGPQPSEPTSQPPTDPTPATKEDVIVAQATEVAAAQAQAAERAQAKAEKIAAKQTRQKNAKVITAHKSLKAVPVSAPKLATIDDIDAPEIDKANEQAKFQSESTAFNEDMDRELNQENEKQAQKLAATKSTLDDDADQLDAENERALNEAAKANQQEQAEIAAANKARRAKEAQTIAAAAANEQAAQDSAVASAREAAAQAEAADASREAAAFAAAEKAANERAAAREAARQLQAQNTDAEDGLGSGNQGEPNSEKAAGLPNGVRSLDQLRQRPGNPVPQYSRDERLRRQQGQVTYVAYVKKDGSMGQFRQLTSTGYQNLDSKTLQALQQWKFFPGQEGWVELPFSWDLKGGAQSLDGLLRVKRSDLNQM